MHTNVLCLLAFSLSSQEIHRILFLVVENIYFWKVVVLFKRSCFTTFRDISVLAVLRL